MEREGDERVRRLDVGESGAHHSRDSGAMNRRDGGQRDAGL